MLHYILKHVFILVCSIFFIAYSGYIKDLEDFKKCDNKILSALRASNSQYVDEIVADIIHMDDSVKYMTDVLNGTKGGLSLKYYRSAERLVKDWRPVVINTSILKQEFKPEYELSENQLERLYWLRLYLDVHWQILEQVVAENKPLESLMPEE